MSKPTVLVVDDELFFRRLYTEILSEDDYHVETADSGAAALLRLNQGGIDLVLTDMVMPGRDGLEVLRHARSLDNPPEVILATGHATLETAIQALKTGARDYLIKPFDPDELRHLARTCLDQRRLLDENQLLKSQIRLFQKGQSLASLLDIAQLLKQTLVYLTQEADGARGLAFSLEKNGSTKLHACHELEESQADALARYSFASLGKASGMQRLSKTDLGPSVAGPADLETMLLFPLHCQKVLKGGIVLLNPPGAPFSASLPLSNLMFLAEQTGIGFDNAYRYQGARELIYTDDLTGLYNQRYLDIVLEQEIRRSERYHLEFSIIFLDLDLFKNVNDQHGHIAGSTALKEVAGILRNCIREVDVPFRYGGDEFTALLVETGVEGAAVVAERVRREIEKHTFLTGMTEGTRLTASVGHATYPHHATDKRAVLDLADRAMYHGKQTRNVTCSAGDLNSP